MRVMERLETSETLAEARFIVTRFERCALTRKEWSHRAHLTVAAWYLLHNPAEEAKDKMVSGILRFNRARGIETSRTSGYHETLTRFWLAIGQRFFDELPSGIPLLEKIDHFVATYEHEKGLFLEYYSQELIWSWEARRAWVEPDLKSLRRG